MLFMKYPPIRHKILIITTLSSSLPLSSSQSQDYSKLTMAFPRLHSISALLSHLSPFSLYVPNNKYLPPQYFQLASSC